MPELGGLHEMADVKALVLYLLRESGGALKESQLTDIMMADGLVDYFDCTSAIEELLMAGMIDITSLEESDKYQVAKKGMEVINEYEQRLPHNVKSKTLEALQANLRRKQEDDEIYAEIAPSESGFMVHCTIREEGEIMLAYSVLVPDRKDAYDVAKRFRENPAGYYQKIMEVVMNENLFTKGDE